MNERKIAFITGITGQDGSYLVELLIEKNYIVHGLIRRSSILNTRRIDHLYQDPHVKDRHLFLHYGDITDSSCITRLIAEIRPDEIYHLAAQSHVKVSFEMPVYTSQADALGTLHLLEAIRSCGLTKKTKFYQASSSEMFGKVQEIPQSETTPFYPRSPYGVAKVYAYWITVNYREAYGIFACNGILFNHASPRRGRTFVLRKICHAVAEIKMYKGEYPSPCLYIGNLEAQRDWGHAKDYCQGMISMLQHEIPDDYVLSTGEVHSVRDAIHKAFECVDIDIEWKGKKGSLEEYAVRKDNGQIVVRIDERYFRPSEVDFLMGDSSKARKYLGWSPSYSFENIIKEIILSELAKYNC